VLEDVATLNRVEGAIWKGDARQVEGEGDSGRCDVTAQIPDSRQARGKAPQVSFRRRVEGELVAAVAQVGGMLQEETG
jgi:hypothetical protein